MMGVRGGLPRRNHTYDIKSYVYIQHICIYTYIVYKCVYTYICIQIYIYIYVYVHIYTAAQGMVIELKRNDKGVVKEL